MGCIKVIHHNLITSHAPAFDYSLLATTNYLKDQKTHLYLYGPHLMYESPNEFLVLDFRERI